ncbi:hypothetical protein M434DRAFT_307303 [Hypoxylon sp. CO27-5]|nr:hypothetical protein M434DRAFT_307303 [Hypoxylon sp. CO27-5]
MNKLPPEITQRVLLFTDDVDSLRAAALSCTALYAAFMGAEKMIATRVLLRQIPWDVLPEALAVEASRHIRPGREREVDKFGRDYLLTRSRKFSRFGLTDALRLGRLYNIVEFLARRVAHDALSNGPPLFSSESSFSSYSSGPTVTELRRIQRTLYRFQLYCNMFGGDLTLSRRQQELYFRYFSRVEDEQLASLQDLLVRIVAIPYNDLVDHDVRQGASDYPCMDLSSGEPPHIISRGLESIHRLVIAESYEKPG